MTWPKYLKGERICSSSQFRVQPNMAGKLKRRNSPVVSESHCSHNLEAESTEYWNSVTSPPYAVQDPSPQHNAIHIQGMSSHLTSIVPHTKQSFTSMPGGLSSRWFYILSSWQLALANHSDTMTTPPATWRSICDTLQALLRRSRLLSTALQSIFIVIVFNNQEREWWSQQERGV